VQIKHHLTRQALSVVSAAFRCRPASQNADQVQLRRSFRLSFRFQMPQAVGYSAGPNKARFPTFISKVEVANQHSERVGTHPAGARLPTWRIVSVRHRVIGRYAVARFNASIH